jgi:hypothetical protein
MVRWADQVKWKVEVLMVMSIAKFAEQVSEAVPEVTDMSLNRSWRFETDGQCVTFGGMLVGALPMYQLKGHAGGTAPIADLRGNLRDAQSSVDQTRTRGLSALNAMVNGLNADFDRLDGRHTDYVARTFLREGGAVEVGGIVSKGYSPVRHSELVESIVDSEAFADASVVKYDADPGRLEAFVMFDHAQWKVDGETKAGVRIHNGQFGDRSLGYSAILFRLRCTNGAMDVLSREGAAVRRHYGGIDIATDVAHCLERTSFLASRVDVAQATALDVLECIVELCRRGLFARVIAAKAYGHSSDLGGGGIGGEDLWTLSQAVAAAGRTYAIGQYKRITELSGRLLVEGFDAVADAHPLRPDAASRDEVLEYINAA